VPRAYEPWLWIASSSIGLTTIFSDHGESRRVMRWIPSRSDLAPMYTPRMPVMHDPDRIDARECRAETRNAATSCEDRRAVIGVDGDDVIRTDACDRR